MAQPSELLERLSLSFERNLLISVLKSTKKGCSLIKDVNTGAKLPADVCMYLLQKLQNENLLYLQGDRIQMDSEGRLEIALKAVSLGADIQELSNHLCWREFEEIAALALKNNGYTVTNNVRFKQGDRRWEIDVVGCRKPLVACIDCKHWQHSIASSALRKIVEAQIDRTQALAEALPNPKLKLECAQWEKAKFIPAIIALFPSVFKFYYEVPIVPVLSMQDFISQLPMHIDHVKVLSHTYAKL